MGGSNNSDKLICALSYVFFFFENMGCGSAKIASELASSLSPCTIFVSERRSIAGYVTERTDKHDARRMQSNMFELLSRSPCSQRKKTHARGCKATIRILEF